MNNLDKVYLHSTVLLLSPLKTDNQGFSDVFREYRKRPVERNGLRDHLLPPQNFPKN